MNLIKKCFPLLLLIHLVYTTDASVNVARIFSDHMVMQRQIENPVWGTADAGEKITVSIAGQKYSTIADKYGKWRVKLKPMEAGGPFTMIVKGTNKLEVKDILIGEVWVCSGQSNMGFSMKQCNQSEVEIASANYPKIRLLRVPTLGAVEPQADIDTIWNVCSPETVGGFSAIGYLFGRRIYNTLKVPVGLIDAAWGGTPCEAWLPRKAMDTCSVCIPMLKDWDDYMTKYTDDTYERDLNEYKDWLAAGKPGRKRFEPVDERTGRHRPANNYNGMISPIVGYGIKGVIWFQGEGNIGRSYQHRTLFPLLINSWRKEWGQGDFPFYWVQLADFNEEDPLPSESMWAEFRESQTMTLSVPNTGEAVSIDYGEARDIHPRDKQIPANRLVRHALANDYGIKMVAGSPRFKSIEIEGNKIVITFTNIDKGLYAFDVEEVKGFAIAGKDKKFVWATAKISGKDKVEVYADEITDPVAVRYGWANNPVVNLYDRNSLPVTPFRTDSWPGVTFDKFISQHSKP